MESNRFDWNWNLKNIKQDKNINVFTVFSCGGGSSMGYKRAGFNVIGNVEIDPEINKIYVENLHPKLNFNMDVREFAKLETYPKELMNLDILDGSPPCTTFSTAGKREKTWGIAKVFREGQKKQTLDDLFFVFLDVVAKLKPKVFIAENVTGIIKGNAKGYCNEILSHAKSIGYKVQIFKLDASIMDDPQKRERIFFIGNRLEFPKLKLNFNHRPILFGEVRGEKGVELDGKLKTLLNLANKTDRTLASVNKRCYGSSSCFTNAIIYDDKVCPTITTSDTYYRFCDKTKLSDYDRIVCSTFPLDYNFYGNTKFLTGMCVPPNMMANIATEIYNQWFSPN